MGANDPVDSAARLRLLFRDGCRTDIHAGGSHSIFEHGSGAVGDAVGRSHALAAHPSALWGSPDGSDPPRGLALADTAQGLLDFRGAAYQFHRPHRSLAAATVPRPSRRRVGDHAREGS